PQFQCSGELASRSPRTFVRRGIGAPWGRAGAIPSRNSNAKELSLDWSTPRRRRPEVVSARFLASCPLLLGQGWDGVSRFVRSESHFLLRGRSSDWKRHNKYAERFSSPYPLRTIPCTSSHSTLSVLPMMIRLKGFARWRRPRWGPAAGTRTVE